MPLNKELNLRDNNAEEYLLKYAKKYSVLYVDDDKPYRELMKDILDMFFDTVIIAENGAEALKLYKEFTPNIVITDIVMPKLNGLQLIEEIQKINSEVGFIILTGFIENVHLLKALELGVDKYLIKPIDKEKFFARLYETIFDLEFINRFDMMQEEMELLNLALELSPVFTLLETDGKIRYINNSFLDFLGYKSMEACIKVNENFYTFIKNETANIVYRNYEEYKHDALNFENNSKKVYIKDKNNALKAFQLTNKFYPNINTLVSVFTDINSLDKNSMELKKLSEIDTLTNLYNKYKFDNYLNETFENFLKKKYQNVSLVMISIDNLSAIKNLYGNQVRDKVIRSVANFVKKNLQNGGFLARYGSEEFVIIYKDVNLESAFKKSDSLRISISKEYKSKLTCSFGVTEFMYGDTVKEILFRANDAIMKAKKGGKNLVMISV
ncbi:MAG: diguanylate cyclase [Campylobacterales bacterium]|nr:diguanylate cyclase [Campylobacterales bacterium]